MRNILCLLLFGLCALLPACLKVESTTTMQKDGSGTYARMSTLELEPALAYQQTLLAKAGSLGIPEDEAEENPFAEVDAKAQAAALKGRHGLSEISSTETSNTKEKTRTYGLKLKFASLRDLYESGVIEDTTVTLERVRKGKAWRLTTRHVHDDAYMYIPEEDRPEEKDEGEESEKERDETLTPQQEQLRKVRLALLKSVEPWWRSIQITRKLTLPGRVLKTNGVKDASGFGVTWKLAFKDLADPKNLRQEVVFEAVKGLALTPFHLTARDIENAREVFEIERDEKLREKKASTQREDK